MSTRDETENGRDEADELLVRFVRGRDAACPSCGYNLRDLTAATCPECRERLRLQVGRRDPRLRWFLLVIAPGIFAGMIGVLLAGVAVIASAVAAPGSGPDLGFYLLTAFTLASGAVALAIMWRPMRFIELSEPAQVLWAMLTWGVHLTAFVVTIATMV